MMARRAGALPVRAGASIGLLLFAVLAVGNGLDRMSLQAPALGRLVPPPFRAQAARSDAAQALARMHPEAALASARAAVAADPIHPASTALLATAYIAGDRPDEAEAAFRIAARFGWREPTVQIYWYHAALQAGDLGRAAERAEALLRTRPDMPRAAALLEPLENSAGGRAALIGRMSQRPGRLSHYFQPEPSVGPETLVRRSRVLVELAEAGTRLGCGAIAPFVEAALERGAAKDAQSVWSAHCPEAQPAGRLTDGGFERLGTGDPSPFGWRVHGSGDVTLRSFSKGGGNRAVRMLNSGSAGRLVLRQAVALAPGTYRLTGDTARGRVAASLGCGRPPVMPRPGEGDLASTGQLLRVEPCTRLELGLWLRPGPAEVTLDALRLEKVD